jgi:hypothetical protein
VEREELVARALDFLVRLMDADVPLDEALCSLSALAEQFQPGAIVGGTIIDSRSATFDRVVYPSLLASPFSTFRHVPISSPIFGTCAKAVHEARTIICSDTATEASFDVSWRSLYLGLGIHSVQSAPVFGCNGILSVPSSWRPGSQGLRLTRKSRDSYAMRTILQKPSR